MSTAYWVVAGIAAFAFFGAGMMKVASSREKLLANKNMGWAANYSDSQVKLIGLAEVAGSLGLILPHVFSFAEVLSQVAATCLFLLMVGAANVHRKRKESVFSPLVLGLLALVTIFL